MFIVVETPRQLVTYMGNLCDGVTTLVAPTLAQVASFWGADLLQLPRVHPAPAGLVLAFKSFHEGIDLELGDLRFHINTVGILRLWIRSIRLRWS
jgi:hypothetical protein